MNEFEIHRKLEETFMPHTEKKRRDLFNKRFIHYTSAESGIKIIQDEQFWLRNAKCMNDFNEIQHGHNLLLKYFYDNPDNKNRARFIEQFNAIEDGFSESVFKLFDDWWQSIEYNTFIGSISEHTETENDFGRLSMWRAYGNKGGKSAILFNIPLNEPEKIKVDNIFLVPVSYYTDEELEEHINGIVINLTKNMDFIKSQPAQTIKNMLFITLVLLAVSLKHKGFEEEKEWRIVYLPRLYFSSCIQEDIEVINGIPQRICKMKLEDNPEKNIIGINIKSLISGVIIGPTQYGYTMYEAFAHVLQTKGIVDAYQKVRVSYIPLRENS